MLFLCLKEPVLLQGKEKERRNKDRKNVIKDVREGDKKKRRNIMKLLSGW